MRGTLGRGVMALVPLLLVTACSGGNGEGAAKDRPSATPAHGTAATKTPDADTGPVIDADPARLPATRKAALDLIGRVIADPDSFGPGVVARRPYESDPATWPVLGADCVWRQEKPASSVLATLTRSFEVPAARGKGPIRLSAVMTVHRTREDARWEMAESIEETMRCPTQQLRKGELIGSMISTSLMRGESAQNNSEDALTEAGEYRSSVLGGPHPYLWQQAQALQFTVAVTGKGAKGRAEKEIDDLTTQAQAVMLMRLGSAVAKQS
ncbi:hypothetical protein ACIODX_14395 [Streptomyces sp. NPDC088190]|uniref:hypothetical protein n=1 Tax=unclassified Streptomyces TaxID=2593676 RepID=UPI0037F65BFB